MKKLEVIVLLMGILVLPAVAHASFFDDSGEKWWMNQDQWVQYPGYDPQGRIVVEEVMDNLQFRNSAAYASGWTDGAEPQGVAASKWQLSLEENFAFSVNYHYSYEGGSHRDDEGDVTVDLGYFPSGAVTPKFVTWEAANEVNNLNLNNTNVLRGSADFNSNGDVEMKVARNSFDGTISAAYDASTGELDFVAEDGIPGTTEWHLPVRDIKSVVGGETDSLFIALTGGSDGAALAPGHAYFSNFNLQSGKIVTPEPISSALFLLGAGALAGARRLRKKI
jgi:hypothetical protein